MPKFASVDDYLASLPPEQREVVEEIERRVLLGVPGADRVIRYDMPTWQVEGVSLVHAAAWKQHVSLIPCQGQATLIWTPTSRLMPERKARSSCHTPGSTTHLIERVVRRLLETRHST